MARILCVGNATLDFSFAVDRLPREDEEMRAQELVLARGGNAANTAVVLARLGNTVAFAGTLGTGPHAATIEADLDAHGVVLVGIARHAAPPPLSFVLRTPDGARTIVHHRALPEYTLEAFATIDLAPWDWLHFEGRPGPALAAMMRRARASRPALPLSLEAEKPRPGLDELLPLADVVLASKTLAEAWGYDDPRAFLRHLEELAPSGRLFLGWGAEGAWARAPSGEIVHAPAEPPARVVDSVGAGDTFNAGVIDACLRGGTEAEALARGVRLAGRKCGVQGFDFPLD